MARRPIMIIRAHNKTDTAKAVPVNITLLKTRDEAEPFFAQETEDAKLVASLQELFDLVHLKNVISHRLREILYNYTAFSYNCQVFRIICQLFTF